MFFSTSFWSAFSCVGFSRWAEHPFREVCRSCTRGNERDMRWGRCVRSSPNSPQQGVAHTVALSSNRHRLGCITLPKERNDPGFGISCCCPSLPGSSLGIGYGYNLSIWGTTWAEPMAALWYVWDSGRASHALGIVGLQEGDSLSFSGPSFIIALSFFLRFGSAFSPAPISQSDWRNTRS